MNRYWTPLYTHPVVLACWALALLLLTAASATAQEVVTASSGRDFYLAFPWLERPGAQAFRINITAVKSAEVTLGFTESGWDTTVSVPGGGRWEYLIPFDSIALELREYRSRRTVHIRSTAAITVNVTYDAPYLSDAYTAFPTPSLGFEYVAMSHPSDDRTRFHGVVTIIATDDATDVRITPTATTMSGALAGFEYGITLNRGEVYVMYPANAHSTDMTGTRVRSSKPVAVVSGHRATHILATDATNSLLEQMMPVADWGRRFYSAQLPGQDSAIYRVYAASDGTEVRVNGRRIATLSAGRTAQFGSPSSAVIEASAPVMLAQYTTHFPADSGEPSGDPSMMMLNPLESYTESFVWSTPTLAPRMFPGDTLGYTTVRFDHYVLVTAPANGRESVRLDGAPLAFDITYNDGAYYSAIRKLSPGVHTLSAQVPINAQLFGYSEFDAYSMPAGVRLREPFRAPPLIARTCAPFIDTTIWLLNVGSEQLNVTSGSFSAGISGVVTAPGGFPYAVAPNSSRPIRVRIDLPSFGRHEGTLTITTTTSGARPLRIPIDILRDSLAVDALPATLAFAELGSNDAAGDTLLQVVNTGTGPVRFAASVLSGPFVVLDPTAIWTIATGDTARVPVRFAPPSSGVFSGTIAVTPLECGAPDTVELHGRKRASAGIIVEVDHPDTVRCSAPGYAEFRLVVHNPGDEPLRVDSIENRSPVRTDFAISTSPVAVDVAPGDSLVVMVRFQPAATGARQGIFRVWNSASPGRYRLVTVDAHRDSTAVAAVPAALDFGITTGCDTTAPRTVQIQNTGTSVMRLDSLWFEADEFALLAGMVTELAPGQSVELSIGFRGNGPGVRTDTLWLRTEPCGEVLVIALRAEQRGAGLSVSADTLDFGTVAQCQLPAGLSVEIINSAAVAQTIVATSVSNERFVIAPQLPGRELQPGEQARLDVTLLPGPDGSVSGTLSIRSEPCARERQVHLRGRVAALDLTVDDRLDLGAVGVGQTAAGSAMAYNDGELPIVIDRIELDPAVRGLTLLSPQLPRTLAPGDSLRLVFGWEPADVGTSEATVWVVAQAPCEMRRPITIRVEVEQAVHLQLVLPDTSAALDRPASLPLRASTSRVLRGPVELLIDVRFGRTVLLPLGVHTPVGAAEVRIVGDGATPLGRVLRLHYRGVVPTDGVLLFIDALPLLGDAEWTALEFVSASPLGLPESTAITIDTVNGRLTIDGICRSGGGTRLILRGTRPSVERISPNPTADLLTIAFQVPADDHVVLVLHDPSGREVLRVLDGMIRAGEHQLAVDVSMLPTGVYRCELRTSFDRATRNFTVVR